MTAELESLGWDEGWKADFDRLDTSGARPARVSSQHRNRWMVLSASGPHEARVIGSASDGMKPVTGDWVGCAPGPLESDPLSIVFVLPRRSAVTRGSAGESKSRQVLAANVDVLWIVQALDRPPNLRSLERYLAVAWDSGASPEIVLTKSDLARDRESSVDSVTAIAFGTPVHVVSIEDRVALDALRSTLEPGRTVALLGPSGAGKSTLINRLGESEVAETGDVRRKDRKGRHTTTGRELFRIYNGALLVDTPGMRELKVVDLDEGLGHAFPEIEALSAECRFRDCTHRAEPGCAVLEAVERGALSEERLASFRKLQAEAAYERARIDPHARAERISEHKTALRTLRYHPKYRRGDDDRDA